MSSFLIVVASGSSLLGAAKKEAIFFEVNENEMKRFLSFVFSSKEKKEKENVRVCEKLCTFTFYDVFC